MRTKSSGFALRSRWRGRERSAAWLNACMPSVLAASRCARKSGLASVLLASGSHPERRVARLSAHTLTGRSSRVSQALVRSVVTLLGRGDTSGIQRRRRLSHVGIGERRGEAAAGVERIRPAGRLRGGQRAGAEGPRGRPTSHARRKDAGEKAGALPQAAGPRAAGCWEGGPAKEEAHWTRRRRSCASHLAGQQTIVGISCSAFRALRRDARWLRHANARCV